MTKPSEQSRALIDTNVLVYAYDADSPHHLACVALCRQEEERRSGRLFLAPQVLLEFFIITTHPVRCRYPMRQADALVEMRKLSATFRLIQPPADVHLRSAALVCEAGLSSREIYDAALAATALANDIQHIYTFDAGYQRIPGISVLQP